MTATLALLIVGVLSVTLPDEYRPVDSTSERIAMIGPPGRYATQEFRSWRTADGRAIYLFYWVPSPPRDLGPMKADAEWPARVAGRSTQIVETSVFMGRPQRAFVVHLGFDRPEAAAMIYATGVERSEFEKLLAGITRAR